MVVEFDMADSIEGAILRWGDKLQVLTFDSQNML